MMILILACLQPTVDEGPAKSSAQLACERSCDTQAEACPGWDKSMCIESCATSAEFMRGECLGLAEAVWECYTGQSWLCVDNPELQDAASCDSEELSLDACMTISDSGD